MFNNNLFASIYSMVRCLNSVIRNIVLFYVEMKIIYKYSLDRRFILNEIYE